MNRQIHKILIANRGEIARRIIRTAQKMGIATIAVYSDADAKALYVKEADEAFCLGDPNPQASYLNIDKIIAIAKEAAADAIHPGYGFLSENAHFADACEKAGIIFIGPSSHNIRLMGDKIEAKKALENTSVPLVPSIDISVGAHGRAPLQLTEAAEKIGYPVLLKAAAGGGGKGMRVVREEGDLQSSFESAQREAKQAFGDDRVFVEKYIDQPHHIEVQILADQHGKCLALWERECSVQRRHQKIIEEAPSPNLNLKQKRAIWEAAREVAQSVDYTNAGTVEFIFDGENFFFLEMNTRLQVEHPVTESILGQDLVRWQIDIAQGKTLWLQSSRGDRPVAPTARGHAIELRIYAEDPSQNFLPSPGRIEAYDEPAGPGIRVDSGVTSDWDVPMFYDPMLSKLIVWDETRPRAIKKALKALQNYRIDGITTNIEFLKEVLSHPDFATGHCDTGWIERTFTDWTVGATGRSPLHDIDINDIYSPWSPRDASVSKKRREAKLGAQGLAPSHDPNQPVQIKAPMPGRLIKIFIKEGDQVEAGETLIVSEAMKMEHRLAAPRAGTVTALHKGEGEQVGMNELLVEIE